MRTGGLRGNMQQCLAELRDSDLPADFKLAQVRSLLRYLREVSNLVNHIKSESGFECDTTAYLEILCAKEESNLFRRVSDTRILKQVYLCYNVQTRTYIALTGSPAMTISWCLSASTEALNQF